MNSVLVALFFGLGVAGFVWTKVGRRTGSADPKAVYMTAGLAGLVAFIFFFTLLKYVLSVD
jgi:hypothetical protein